MSVDTIGAYSMVGELAFLSSPDSRSISTTNRGNADGSLAYGTTSAISCLILGVELPMPKPPATRARWIQGERIVEKWN